ncbi:hypothetical protein [Legionella cincinnatiensis]|uniref:Transmembrane protein (Fibronectin III domain and Gp5 C-terminal repeat) n=1 Tax=Legionella cincinnatiensis TaxID=28085 RepID=A0A378IHI2_9GAMM|nr:hypothetical protein [Legionella cincinnatiensis]KTC83584.1 hypothetical protein Lcin_2271 [Legionella cincinnatiensis]STX34456.1 transmembrane protein (fibronectin III domain and Gp5 C-terminal repeat) [Legionella cincinnatiensis]
MKLPLLMPRLGLSISAFYMITAHAGIPVWTFTPDPNFPPTVSVSPTGTATVKYLVQNNSHRAHQLVIKPMQGVTQVAPCSASGKNSCTLVLNVTGSALPEKGVSGGPYLCQQNPDGTPNINQCYQPTNNALHITLTNTPPPTDCGNIYITNSGEGKIYIVNGTTHTFNANNCTKTLPSNNSQPFAITRKGPAGNFYISDLQTNNVIFEYNSSLDQLGESDPLPIPNDSFILGLFAHQNNNYLYANTVFGTMNGVYPILFSNLSVGPALAGTSNRRTIGTAMRPDGTQLWVGYNDAPSEIEIFDTTNNMSTDIISNSGGQDNLTSISFGQNMAYILFDNGGGNVTTLDVINDLNNLPNTISPVMPQPSLYDDTRFGIPATDNSTYAAITMNPNSTLFTIYSNTGNKDKVCEFTLNQEFFSAMSFNSTQNEYVFVTFTSTAPPNIGTYKVYFVPNNSFCTFQNLTLQENTPNNAPIGLAGMYIE